MQNIYKNEKVYVKSCTKLKIFPYLTGGFIKIIFQKSKSPLFKGGLLKGGFIKRLNVLKVCGKNVEKKILVQVDSTTQRCVWTDSIVRCAKNILAIEIQSFWVI